jgi:acetolactate synthase-1/3 small subunit
MARAQDTMVVEATGNENKISAFLEMIEPFGIIELARTGTVSLRRGRSDS